MKSKLKTEYYFIVKIKAHKAIRTIATERRIARIKAAELAGVPASLVGNIKKGSMVNLYELPND